ncbi:dihydroneopterin aldolase [Natranaerovirga pectinivora]|uniref:7,8-dihydroneopterin aldolase n=1 Tax=Natranaerovirga pectinivora TaxID=682400 RepID=A0A4R3MN03_9FIRM|nr:dihydroneopterin aldolase [Natranaerovirga pectinivora]TCT13972.1 dihydroneopterin aldolase [Natranaerovirga pectinivora]
MDKIIMKNLGFYGYHGVLQEEKTLGQKFFIDVELYVDLKKAGETDDLNYTINYATVYDLIKDITENKVFNLIEALGEHIVNKILSHYQEIKEINIRIKKPEAPVKGIYDYFGVELRRKRNG